MKNVLITGASRGIGASCARLFARKGFRVLINYCSSHQKAEELCSTVQAEGGCAYAVCADVSDSEQVRRMFHEISEHFGGVDILINNAGIAQQKLFCDVTEEEWDKIFNVNMKSMYLCTQQVLPHMIHNKCGSIINISSMWGITGASCEVPYSAAKAAVIGFTKALAKELAPSGIRVNCVAPGAVDTDMNASLSEEDLALLREETPLGCIGSAEDIAAAVYFLASDSSRFTTGQILSPNGGLVI